jgi:hypothetical protein
MTTTKRSGFDTAGPLARVFFAIAGVLIFWHAYQTQAPYGKGVHPLLINAAIAYATGVVLLKIISLTLSWRAKRWLKQIAAEVDLTEVLSPDAPTASVGQLGYVLKHLGLRMNEFIRMVTRNAMLALLVGIAAAAASLFFLVKAAFLVNVLWVLGGLCFLQALCKLLSILSVTTETIALETAEQTHTVSKKSGLIIGFNPPGLIHLNLDLSTTRSESQTAWYRSYD